jgi:hypothetical protein
MFEVETISQKVLSFFREILKYRKFSSLATTRNGFFFYDLNNEVAEYHKDLFDLAGSYSFILDRYLEGYSIFREAIVEGLQSVVDAYFEKHPEVVLYTTMDTVLLANNGKIEKINDLHTIFEEVLQYEGRK